MRPTFNLLHEPWIPALLPSGQQLELSLLDALRGAPSLLRLCPACPLEAVALHRLLLAIVHRVFGPADEAAWEALWRRQQFEADHLWRYLAAVEGRFDLFDPVRPFHQAAGLPERLASPVRRLALDQASGHQVSLWDHHHDAVAQAVPAAQTARWLLAHQCFCLSGRCAGEAAGGGAPGGPLAYAAVFMPMGANLFETLLLNLVPYDPARHAPLPVLAEDRPAWEEAETGPRPPAGPAGYLDYLTWQPRRVQLMADAGPGPVTVSQAVVMAGRPLSVSRTTFDPLLGYERDRRTGAWRAVGPQEGAGCQELARVLRPSHERWRRPLVLELLAARAARGLLPAGAGLRLAITGLRAHQARIDACHAREWTLPPAYLYDADLVADLEVALRVAREAGAALASRARQLLAAREAGSGGARGYWQALEPAADLLLARLPGPMRQRTEALRWWADLCRRQAWRGWEQVGEAARGQPQAWPRRVMLGQSLSRALPRASDIPEEEALHEAV